MQGKVVRIMSNMELLKKDLFDGFITEVEYYNLLQTYRSIVDTHGDEVADDELGKFMNIYYMNRYKEKHPEEDEHPDTSVDGYMAAMDKRRSQIFAATEGKRQAIREAKKNDYFEGNKKYTAKSERVISSFILKTV